MTEINLTTIVNAPIEKVFDINRNIDIHLLSTSQSNEKVIAGRTSGLIELGETVTWKAKHFGFWLTHKSLISEMDFPIYFVDEMLEGQFKSFRHEHSFEVLDGKTVVTDKIQYETPFGIFGKIFDKMILKNYLTEFIRNRNAILKGLTEKQQQ
ncbi:SRPBCC family protein [Flavobacterium sp. 3HN19-14]|uniref:SRPBCC family protein n=1 Tax=Flavobacterium sp. 3HN19-14 TaxID=3448133 RepID=UPI003EE321FA